MTAISSCSAAGMCSNISNCLLAGKCAIEPDPDKEQTETGKEAKRIDEMDLEDYRRGVAKLMKNLWILP